MLPLVQRSTTLQLYSATQTVDATKRLKLKAKEMVSAKKLQVFVSSTYSDLREERQAAVEAILKSGHIPAGMELFAAGSESQLVTIRRWIDESDVYMLILGGRYGSVHAPTSLSYTELEYDYAVSKGKPVFAVVIGDAALDNNVKVKGKAILESERPKELKLFREKVLSRVSSFFNDAKDIKLAVHETISDFLNRYEFTGWVSGAELLESSALIEEISILRKKNDALEKELTEFKKNQIKLSKPTKRWDDGELVEILRILDQIKIKTSAFDKDKGAQEFALSRFLEVFRDDLITGVTNQVGASDIKMLLYYNVCPKLEVHGLAALEKVPGVRWQRYRLTPKGMALIALIDKKRAELAKIKKK